MALPDLAGQGLGAIVGEGYRSDEIRQFQERHITIQQADRRYDGYFNITHQPTYAPSGRVAAAATEPVRAYVSVAEFCAFTGLPVAEVSAALNGPTGRPDPAR